MDKNACQRCGCGIVVDLIIPDELWEVIKPKLRLSGSGVLCGKCIMEKIDGIGEYAVYKLLKVE
jgi:hypothetical protein